MTPLRIKICGVTSVADACLAADLGADAIGLNFHPDSPRHVEPATAASILAALPPFVEAVAVFVHCPADAMIQQVAPLGRIHTLQRHGRHPDLGVPVPFRFIPAFAVRQADDLAAVTAYLERCRAAGRPPAAVLVDGHAPGQYGGTGRTAPWELLAAFRPGVPLLLAGGLTPDNVAAAVRTVRPYAVDVASGVESGPGRKDPDKLRRFIAQAREAQNSV